MSDGALASERMVHKRVEVAAPIDQVWDAWTTDAGLRRWLVDDSHVGLRVGGPYEWYFLTDAPRGSQGSEGCQVIGFQAPTMLTFTWNAPPSLPEAREQRTVVLLRLLATAQATTAVHLTELGWGDGGQWDDAFDYFDAAWGRVLDRLAAHFAGAAELPEA